MTSAPRDASWCRANAVDHLVGVDPAFAERIPHLPTVPTFPGKNRRLSDFRYLVRSVVYQQLAGAAARTIYGRVCALGEDGRFPAPRDFLEWSDESLRSAGLSRNKIRAVRSLATQVEEGALRFRSLRRRSDREIVDALTGVWGIGEWTAQMYLLFKLGRSDVMPTADLGVQEGIRRLDGLENRPTPGEVEERSRAWHPYRSVASWYLWRLADE